MFIAIEATLGVAFVAILLAVERSATADWDRRVLISFRDQGDISLGIGPLWLPETIRDITGLGSTAVLATVIAVAAGFLVAARQWRSLVTLIGAVVSAELIVVGLKFAVYRPRPGIVPGSPRVFTTSFPSSHAMLSVVTYVLLAALLAQRCQTNRLRIYAFFVAAALTVAVGLSRIYLGVHWPTDVIAGWFAGLAWVMLCWRLAARWCRRDATAERLT